MPRTAVFVVAPLLVAALVSGNDAVAVFDKAVNARTLNLIENES